MEIDDYVKSHPQKQHKQQPQQSQPQQQILRYTCVICHNSFDNPTVKFLGSFGLELFIFFALLFVGALFMGSIGIFIAFIIALVISVVRRFSKKEICPYCKSENFIKNR